MTVRDTVFARRVDGLLTPDMLSNVAEGVLAATAFEHFATYRQAPAISTMARLIGDKVKAKLIRSDLVGEVVDKLREIKDADISDRDYVIDQVATFARHQALEKALLKAVDLKEKGDFASIDSLMKKTLLVGAADADEGVDYWENIGNRSTARREIAAGLRPPSGISTGVSALDKVLKHEGWGIAELSVFMGPPKSGKSTALIEFVKNASLLGKNCLYVSLEVATPIIEDRMDANITCTLMNELGANINDIEDRILKAKAAGAGRIRMHQFPPGVYTPAKLQNLIERYRARGVIFDLVAIDYADIMAPTHRTDNPIENSKSVWVDLRAIAMTENIAMLTATQTNRDGAKSSVIKMTEVADDFNKVRIADLVLSINRTDEERMAGEARLYFAASRNQRGDFTVRIKQDLERMRFLEAVLGIE